MTKEENILLSNKIRAIIREARKKGYLFKFFFSRINYNSVEINNFMNHNRKMTDSNLLTLKEFIEKTFQMQL
ncbi:MAG: hypothetical protein IKE28_02230 [Solobacterium sp.]|nr:hypothetical protein [Solobacterium sp.]